MKRTVTKLIDFCAGHRLLNYEGKCKNLHGHNYRAEITVSGEIDSRGFVIDFGEIKEKIGKWIDENWDHATIVDASDWELQDFLLKQNSKVFVMPESLFNPTAENMAIYLFHKFHKDYENAGYILESIKIWETNTGCAEFKR